MITDNFPTLSSVAEEVRSILADVRVQGGKLYSTEILMRPIQSAVRDAFSLLRNVGGVRIMKTAYFKLPANQMVIMPRSAGVLDLIAPVSLKQRSSVTFLTVSTAAKSGRNLEITCSASHGQTGNVYVTLNDISGFPLANGLWTATVSGATTLTVLGCDVTGTWATDATKQNNVTVGANGFTDMDLATSVTDKFEYRSSDTNTMPDYWSFETDRISIPPLTVDRQLQLRYYSSREVPDTVDDTIEIPDSLTFLGTLAAANVTITRMPSVSKELFNRVWGAGRERTAEGGLARQLVLAALKAESNRRYLDNTRPGIHTTLYG